jgi:hypothetical protein
VVWNSLTPPPLQPVIGGTPQRAVAHYHNHLTTGSSTPATSTPISATPSYSEVPRSSPTQRTSTLPPLPPQNAAALPRLHRLHAAPPPR